MKTQSQVIAELVAALRNFTMPLSMHVMHPKGTVCAVCQARRAIQQAEGR